MNSISSTKDAFEVSIERVRKRFIERARTQVQELDILIYKVEADPQDQATWMDLARIVHKIAGVADTLGFERLGQLARETEDRLINPSDEITSAMDDQKLCAVDILVNELDAVARSVLGTQPFQSHGSTL